MTPRAGSPEGAATDRATAAPAPPAAAVTSQLQGSLRINRRLSQWLRFAPDGKVDVFSGKVEIGQGILTALAQIAAEELDLRPDRIRMIAASTAYSPNEAVTSGSLSIQESGAALRQACAEARAIYLDAAAAQLDAAVDTLQVADGNIFSADGRSTSYWALADDALLEREASGRASVKCTAYRVVGTASPRLDLPPKIFGQAHFIHDLELPGMLHGRMLRPPSQSATLISVDERDAQACAGVLAVVRDGSLLGVLADTERHADAAIAKLSGRARWRESASLPDEDALSAWLKSQAADTTVVAGGSADPVGDGTLPAVARTIKAAYAKPYLAHASIAPSCALAQFDGRRLEVWTHSQGIFNLRHDLALAFGMEQDAIVVRHVESAGCYGHNGADDAAYDAARLARAAAGRPVRVQWTRADELGWAPFGPAMAVDLEADLDADGAVIGWRHAIWSNGHGTRPGRAATPALLGSWHTAQAFPQPIAVNAPAAAGGGAERNALPLYVFPAPHIVSHRVLAMPLRTSALRALGAFANVFAMESFIDELALATASDPIEFRSRHLQDPRARAVIERAVENSGWRDWQAQEGLGRGIGFARYKNSGAYCAVVAEIEAGAEIRVRRLTIAVDVGLAINPDGVANQIEGGAIQAVSWTLKEAVRFDRTRVTSDSWEAYPILRFSEVPAVTVDIMPSGQPAVGAGEASLGPTAAAIANAVCDALGVRVRTLPITAARIVALLE
jgi:nicotinate dehydrogenase subunit B